MPTPQHYFLKLNPSRPTFAMDMTPEERTVMQEHAAYWRARMAEGQVVVFGPVMDPAGPFGMGVITAIDDAAVRNFTENDPAAKISRYEFFPMHAVLPG